MKMMREDGKEFTEQSDGIMVDLADVMLQRGKGEGLVALIITPTRELALQVKDHITAISKHTDIKVCKYPKAVCNWSCDVLSSCDAHRCVQ